MLLNGDQIAWSDKDLIEAFRTFDTDNKGYIHSGELKYVLSHMDDEVISDQELEEMLDSSKLQTNRKITFNGNNF